MSVSTQLAVTGMTCHHCVASVTEELTALRGVQNVSVDLVVGGASTVTVESEPNQGAAFIVDIPIASGVQPA